MQTLPQPWIIGNKRLPDGLIMVAREVRYPIERESLPLEVVDTPLVVESFRECKDPIHVEKNCPCHGNLRDDKGRTASADRPSLFLLSCN